MSEIHEERSFQTTTDVQIFPTWDSMNLKPELIEAIKKLNWEKPSPVQSRAIFPMSQGKSMVVQSQNGTGKTATFSIGVLQRLKLKSKNTELIVISPTRELAIQSEFFRRRCSCIKKWNSLCVRNPWETPTAYTRA